MTRIVTAFAAAVLLAACATRKEPPRQTSIARADVQPLALSDDFKFTKISPFINDPRDPRTEKPTVSPMLQFERQRVNFGAVSGYDRSERYGSYYNVWWKSAKPADVTVRFEYRQENLGSHVQAKEQFYPGANGTIETKFSVIGDEYKDDGAVTAWRMLLVVDGRIVGLRQSFLWN
jgi:hypothetical protein